ncbi:MAG TPA: biotin--[acetyl-CoA-carboxylase] ligase [Candidatus Eisenbacteria bacterium]|nr:biotin--[acetyl-CoA-carboxylase] ligase [Candidatus Eisenbacteria bacterium]
MEGPRFVHLESVGSTQDVARTLPIGSVVMADYQTHGRGRLSHRWDSPPGSALLVSFVLQPNPLLSLAAGIAAAEACGRGVRLKWPNDLLLDSRKVGGILVEASASRAVCGIGINLSWAPEDAAKLDEPRAELLERLRAGMERWASAPAAEVVARWRELSDTIGQKVRVELPDRIVEGTVQDIDEVGNLVVDGTPISAGSVTVLGS